MALIFQTQEQKAPLGAEKIHGDVLVSDGTLILHDYSNAGCLYGFSLQNGYPVRDLAHYTSKDLGIDNDVRLNYNPDDGNPQLTDGLGIPQDQWGSNSGSVNQWGMNFGKDILEYLSNNNGHEFVLGFWSRRYPDLPNTAAPFLTSTQEVGGNTVSAVRLNVASNGNLTASFGGVSGASNVDYNDDAAHQILLHYKGVGERLDVYHNGIYIRQGASNAVGFGSNSSDLVMGKTGTGNPNHILYRWYIEDLTVSGRTALEVCKKDYQYCTGSGLFSFIEKRPFIESF